MVEAVEAIDSQWFLRAVQWHPEKLAAPAESGHRKILFGQFAAAVADDRTRRADGAGSPPTGIECR